VKFTAGIFGDPLLIVEAFLT